MKKLLTVFTMLAILVLATAGFAPTAQASTQSVSLTLGPGSRACAPALYASFKVYAQGQATPGVRFTVARNNVIIYQSPTDTTTAFAFSASSNIQPYYFPGNFQVCARNLGTKSASVSMTLLTDGNAP